MGELMLIPVGLRTAVERLYKTKVGQFITEKEIKGEYAQTPNRDGSRHISYKVTLVLEDGMHVLQFETTATNTLTDDVKVLYSFCHYPNKQNPLIHKFLPYDLFPGMNEEQFYDIVGRYLKQYLPANH